MTFSPEPLPSVLRNCVCLMCALRIDHGPVLVVEHAKSIAGHEPVLVSIEAMVELLNDFGKAPPYSFADERWDKYREVWWRQLWKPLPEFKNFVMPTVTARYPQHRPLPIQEFGRPWKHSRADDAQNN